MAVLGLDVGGANLKAATTEWWVRSRRFALWKRPDRLADELRRLVEGASFDRLAVTMTGELCDVFADKAEGVDRILDAVEEAFEDAGDVLVWQTTGKFVPPDAARKHAWRTASANWLAAATLAARLAPEGPALFIDVGSTTTDIVAIDDGKPTPQGRTDPDRLACGELVYQGIRRTPVCAILSEACVDERDYSIMNEVFATSLDAHLVLENVEEDESADDTADGRPATIPCAVGRLARMIGSDRSRFTLDHARQLAEEVVGAQLNAILGRIDLVFEDAGFEKIESVVAAGEGEKLVEKIVAEHELLVDARLVRFSEELNPDLSRAACAYAVAVLAEKHPNR
jgi:probable H4MPT-linked C1 transfer pathway protein